MSIMAPRPFDPSLPPAHDGCTCDCHRHPGVMHCVPCCGFGAPAPMEPFTDEQKAGLEAWVKLTNRADKLREQTGVPLMECKKAAKMFESDEEALTYLNRGDWRIGKLFADQAREPNKEE